MLFLFPSFTVIYAIAACLALVSAAAVFERKSNPGYFHFSLCLISLFTWSFAAIFEAGALSVAGKIYWSGWQYLGVVTMAPHWFLFSADYANKRILKSSWLKYLIWVIPAVTLVFVFSDQLNHYLWTYVDIPIDSVNHIAIYGHGFWFYVHLIYSYLLFLTGTFWLVQTLLRKPKENRTPAIVIIASFVIGWVANLIYVMGKSPIPGLDLTSISFIFIAVVLTWMIFNKRLFNLVPIARTRLFENMTDGVIVLDPNDIVIDINPAALTLTEYTGPYPVGLTIWEMFKQNLNLIEPFRDKNKVNTELVWPGKPPRILDVRLDLIKVDEGNSFGQLITIRNISSRRAIELEEKEQRQLAEALVDTASIINSSLNLNDVLNRLLENVDKVVPYDSANIALVDEKGMVHFEKVKGYDKFGTSGMVLSIERKVTDIPNLKKMSESGKPSLNPDTWADPEWVKDLPGSGWIRSYIGAPIKRKEKLLGFINLDAATPDFFKEKHLGRLQALADQAAVAIENAQLFKEMEQLAITDSLTGLYNRRFFYEFAQNELERSKRNNKNLSMIMIDIDHFKKVNDQLGHQIGDKILVEIVKICLSILRKMDVMCRIGGEEFLILLPETEKSDAVHAAERICTAVSAARIKTEKMPVQVTVSIGVADYNNSRNTIEKIISASDQALYSAKAAGRNRVHVN